MNEETLGPESPYAGPPGSGGFTVDDADTGPLPRVIDDGVVHEPPRPPRTWRGRELHGGGPVELRERIPVLPGWVTAAVFTVVVLLGSAGYLVLERL